MKKLLSLFIVLSFIGFAHAGNIAQQNVNFEIKPINSISINEIDLTLLINSPEFSVRKETTYNITTNQGNKKIVGRLDNPLPQGAKLKVNLEPPRGAISKGFVEVEEFDKAIVTNVSTVSQKNIPLILEFQVEPSAGSFKITRILILSIVD